MHNGSNAALDCTEYTPARISGKQTCYIYIFHIWNIEQLAQIEGVNFTLVYDITSPGLEPVGAGLDA